MNKLINFQSVFFAYPYDPKRMVLSDVSFEMFIGNTVNIHGNMASGKTTLLYMMLCLIKPTKGNIVTNSDFFDLKQVGYVPQNPEDSFIADTVYEEIVFDVERDFKLHSKKDWIPSCAGMTPDHKNEDLKSRAQKACDFIGMRYSLFSRDPRTLSTGEAMMCALSRALIKNTDVFILDDPLQGLDRIHREKVVRIIEIFHNDPSKTVVITTSEKNGKEDFPIHKEYILKDGMIHG